MDLCRVVAADIAVGEGRLSAEEAARALASGGELAGGDMIADPARELLRRGGIDRAIHRAIGADLSRRLTDLGAGPRAPLQPLDPDRYLDRALLGQGAMGVVYRALDTELKREVALKFLQGDARDDEARARFLQEAWVTGGLEHPAIVPVYDVGQDREGAPFYAMRIVRGERTLNDAIADARDLDARLALLEPFLKVCDAVRYAHARGVIHRDLKPDNIALGRFGEVFVLDWGLAKLKDRPDLAESRWHRRIQRFREESDLQTIASAMGTPGYMSPEAAEAGEVDERSDLYSLGVILYQIVTGRLPFRFESYADMLEKLLHQRPPEPSSLDAAIPAGLSRIAMRAIARDPAERFASGEDLAAAVRAWQSESAVDREVDALLKEAEVCDVDRAAALCVRIRDLRPGHRRAGEIAAACEERRREEGRRRERAARGRLLRRVAVAGLALATLATVVVGLMLDSRRREAEEARARAENLASFMLVDLRNQLIPIGRLEILGSVALKVKEHYDSLPTASADDDEKRRRGLALQNVADVLMLQGKYKVALEAYEAALPLSAHDPVPVLLRIATIHVNLGDLPRALAAYEETLGRLRAMEGKEFETAFTLTTIGQLVQQRDLDGALARYRAALEILKGAPGDRRWRNHHAACLGFLAAATSLAGDSSAGLTMQEEGLAIRRALVAEEPGNTTWRECLADSLERIARLLRANKREEEALKHFGEAIAIHADLSAKDPTNLSRHESLASAQLGLADASRAAGKPAEALALYRAAVAEHRRVLELNPGDLGGRGLLSQSLSRLGRCLWESDDDEGARGTYLEAIGIDRELLKRDPQDRQRSALLAENLFRAANASSDAEGLPLYREALALSEALEQDEPTRYRIALSLRWIADATGDAAEARANRLRAAEMLKAMADASPAYRDTLANALEDLADDLRDGGDAEGALARYREEVALRAALFDEEPAARPGRRLAAALENIARLLLVKGDRPAALKHLEAAEAVLAPLAAQAPDDARISEDLSRIRESKRSVGG